jgi:uncharacterized protein YjeT (DUF2065 family)
MKYGLICLENGNKEEPMNKLDVITGIGFVVAGCIIYWQNYNKPLRKTAARIGLGLVVAGIVLASWNWLAGQILPP